MLCWEGGLRANMCKRRCEKQQKKKKPTFWFLLGTGRRGERGVEEGVAAARKGPRHSPVAKKHAATPHPAKKRSWERVGLARVNRGEATSQAKGGKRRETSKVVVQQGAAVEGSPTPSHTNTEEGREGKEGATRRRHTRFAAAAARHHHPIIVSSTGRAKRSKNRGGEGLGQRSKQVGCCVCAFASCCGRSPAAGSGHGAQKPHQAGGLGRRP